MTGAEDLGTVRRQTCVLTSAQKQSHTRTHTGAWVHSACALSATVSLVYTPALTQTCTCSINALSKSEGSDIDCPWFSTIGNTLREGACARVSLLHMCILWWEKYRSYRKLHCVSYCDFCTDKLFILTVHNWNKCVVSKCTCAPVHV